MEIGRAKRKKAGTKKKKPMSGMVAMAVNLSRDAREVRREADNLDSRVRETSEKIEKLIEKYETRLMGGRDGLVSGEAVYETMLADLRSL